MKIPGDIGIALFVVFWVGMWYVAVSLMAESWLVLPVLLLVMMGTAVVLKFIRDRTGWF